MPPQPSQIHSIQLKMQLKEMLNQVQHDLRGVIPNLFRNLIFGFGLNLIFHFSFVHFSKILLISPLPLTKLGSKGNFPFKKSFTPGKSDPVIKSLLRRI